MIINVPMNAEHPRSWLCFQLGAREHYAIPRALHSRGLLAGMVTDVWIPPAHPLRHVPVKALRQRWHVDLANASTKAWNLSSVCHSAYRRRVLSGWDRTIAGNSWFGNKAAHWLEGASRNLGDTGTVFSYSYTAFPVFEVAKPLGWRTILGQTNGGPSEERLVRQLHEKYPDCRSTWRPAPASYWANWRRETELADSIVVNSEWSKTMLLEQGVQAERVAVIPLAYAPPASSIGFSRTYPASFDGNRPLRVLFLGQINLRKGVMLLLDAARILGSKPIEFSLVGPDHMGIGNEIRGMSNVRWVGTVSRQDVEGYYRNADVFLFPTHSDGFGLTQLEAQAWKLPLIVSKHCGEVVCDGLNGIILTELTSETIAAALLDCLNDPGTLAHFSGKSVEMVDYGMEALGARLLNPCLAQGAITMP